MSTVEVVFVASTVAFVVAVDVVVAVENSIH